MGYIKKDYGPATRIKPFSKAAPSKSGGIASPEEIAAAQETKITKDTTSSQTYDKTTITAEGSTRVIYTPKGELPPDQPGLSLSQAQADYLTNYVNQQANQPKPVEPVFNETSLYSYNVDQPKTFRSEQTGRIIGYESAERQQSVLLPKNNVYTQSDISRAEQQNRADYLFINRNNPAATVETNVSESSSPYPYSAYEKRVTDLQRSEQTFYNSAGFQRINEAAEVGADLLAYSPAGWILGRERSKAVLKSYLSIGPGTVGYFYFLGGKLGATAEGLTIPAARKEIGGEYLSSFTKPEFLNTFNPTTSQGFVTWTVALTSAVPLAYKMIAAKQRAVITGKKAEVTERIINLQENTAQTTTINELDITIGPKTYKVQGGGVQRSKIYADYSLDAGSYSYKIVPGKTPESRVTVSPESYGDLPFFKNQGGSKATYNFKKATYIDQNTLSYTYFSEGEYQGGGTYSNLNLNTKKTDTGIVKYRGWETGKNNGLPEYNTLLYTEKVTGVKTSTVETGYKLTVGNKEYILTPSKTLVKNYDWNGLYNRKTGEMYYQYDLGPAKKYYVARHEVGHKISMENPEFQVPLTKKQIKYYEDYREYQADNLAQTLKDQGARGQVIKETQRTYTTTPGELRAGKSTQISEISQNQAVQQIFINTEETTNANLLAIKLNSMKPAPQQYEQFSGFTWTKGGTQAQTVSTTNLGAPIQSQIIEQTALTQAKNIFLSELKTETIPKTAVSTLAALPQTKTIQEQKPVTITETRVIQEQRPLYIQKTNQETLVRPIQITPVKQATETRTRIIQEQRPALIQEQIQRPIQEQIQEQRPALIQEQIQRPIQRSSQSQIQITPGVSALAIPGISTPGRAETNKKLYTTFIRRRGSFIAIGTPQPLEKAIGLGIKTVKMTAAASFKVSGAPSGSVRSQTPKIFYESRKEPGVFIQSREQRISSPGEKREITFRGIMTQKIRRLEI